MSKEKETKETLTKAEKAAAKADAKFAKLEAKYEKAYERKDALTEQIDALKQEILNEPDQKKKDKIRAKRDALIAERNSIVITADELKLPMAPKTKKLITAIVAVVVIVALLCTYVATGAVRKGLCASLGLPQQTITAYTITDQDGDKHAVKVSTYNYYFAMVYNNLRSSISQYSQYGISLDDANMNVDFDKKLSKQTRTEDGETQTWLEYIDEQVEHQIKDTYTFYYMALKANDGAEPEITEDQQKELDETLEEYTKSANQYGFTLSGYLQAAMGKGVTEEVFKREAKISYIAQNYEKEYQDELSSKEYTAEELEAYRDENLASLQSVDIMLFECDSEDDAIAFAKELKADGSNFADLASKYTDDEFDKEANKDAVESTFIGMTRGTMERVQYAISTADKEDATKRPGLDWLYSADRKAGDVKQDSTSVVYVLKPVYLSDTKTVTIRHILIAPESTSEDKDASSDPKDCTAEEWATAYDKAKEVLDEFNAGDKSAESFAKLAKDNSSDGNASDGGIYENVVPNQMVPTFNAWCFDSARQAGDTAIVKTQYGYHVMFFEKTGDYTVWEYTAQQALASEDGNTTLDEIEEAVVIKKKWFGSRYFQIDTDIDS